MNIRAFITVITPGLAILAMFLFPIFHFLSIWLLASSGEDNDFKMMDLSSPTQPWNLKHHLLWSLSGQVQIHLCFSQTGWGWGCLGACQSALQCEATWQMARAPWERMQAGVGPSLETQMMSCLKWSTLQPLDTQVSPHSLPWDSKVLETQERLSEREREGKRESCCCWKQCFFPNYNQNAADARGPRPGGPLVGA